MSALQNPVSVPLQIDAMWSDGKTNLAPPTVDFSELKNTVSSGGNFSNAQPWLGDATHMDAESNDYTLTQGIHLHWTLPEALRRGTTIYMLNYAQLNELVQQGVPCALVQKLKDAVTAGQEYTHNELNKILLKLVPKSSNSPLSEEAFKLSTTITSYECLISSNSEVVVDTCTPEFAWDNIFLEIYGPIIFQTAVQMKLPPVPNRWLVIREETVSKITTTWVVESDRLTIPNNDGSAPEGVGPANIPGQFYKDKGQDINNWYDVSMADSFRYLGAKFSAETWQEDGGCSRLTPLTAVGHGTPEFSAFYPNCQGVFGFYDDTADAKISYDYTIIGWFSDANDDPISPSYSVKPWASQSSQKSRCESLSWSVDSPDWDQIDGSTYTAKISVKGNMCQVQDQDADTLDELKVAIGNTSGEALSAYIAQKQGNNDKGVGLSPESILNAAQAGILAQALEPDGPSVIENTLHSHAFQSEDGGWIWKIVKSAPDNSGLSSSAQNEDITLTHEVAQVLNKLNEAQFEFDAALKEQSTQRHLLFTDWCRALSLDTSDSGVGPSGPSAVFPNGMTKNNSGIEPLSNVAGYTVRISADAVKKASVGEKEITHMLVYQATKKLYMNYAKILNQLSTKEYQLKRQAAPRFWRPNDPVVMMIDENGNFLEQKSTVLPPTKIINGKDNLLLKSNNPAHFDLACLPESWNGNNGVPSKNFVAGAVSQISVATCAQSWRPLAILWRANYRHFQGVGSIKTADEMGKGSYQVTDYDAKFVSDNFELDPAGIDLVPKKGKKPSDTDESAVYSGFVTLSEHATCTMKARILQLTGQDNDPLITKANELKLPGALGKGVTKDLIGQAFDSNAIALSQALNGFHDHLLMLNRIPQINVFSAHYKDGVTWQTGSEISNPMWDSCSQSFYNEIGTQGSTSPEQDDIYNPIRAGNCELTSLTLVDAFGQMRRWSETRAFTKQTFTAETLPNETSLGPDAAPTFFFPPRFAQSCRLLFRWLAADGSNDVESNQHPATTPVCGWLVLNRVNENVMVFTQNGTLLGWVPAGNGKMKYMPGKTVQDIIDPFLKQVVIQLQTASNNFFDDVNQALLTIEPRSHRHHVNRSVLESRPLALARVSMTLELSGIPSPHQGYEALASMSFSDQAEHQPATVPGPSPFIKRETCGFTNVNFPVRLGDISMDDDGLVLYWPLDEGEINKYIPVSADSQDQSTISLIPDAGAKPTQALLLLDPRAPVHVSSGVLPVKDITIPPDMYTQALGNMEYIMQTGPVLTPGDGIVMPLPTETQSAWSWLVPKTDDSGWELSVTPKNSDDKMHPMTNPAVMCNGYLKTELDGN